jgi:threonine aldolase
MSQNNQKIINLKSDNVTQPPSEMLLAMAKTLSDSGKADGKADGKDGKYSITDLEKYAAKLFDKEAAMFVPTGTMANLIAVMVHCNERGSEVILGNDSHMYLHEQGGIASIAGAYPRALASESDGTIPLNKIAAAISQDKEKEHSHIAITRMVAIEQTHNRAGGVVLPLDYINELGKLCKSNNKNNRVALHIDGARIFNACVALNVTPAQMCSAADSVCVCLSKALAAPLGALLIGSAAFIKNALRAREVLGGGMRETDIIATGGMYALTKMPQQLSRDHAVAKAFAVAISEVKGISLDMKSVQTNIVVFKITQHDVTANKFAESLKTRGVILSIFDENTVRAVFHYHVTVADVEFAVAQIQQVFQENSVKSKL